MDEPYRCTNGWFRDPCVVIQIMFRIDYYVLLWGHWYPCFGCLVTSHLGLKGREGSALFALQRQM